MEYRYHGTVPVQSLLTETAIVRHMQLEAQALLRHALEKSYAYKNTRDETWRDVRAYPPAAAFTWGDFADGVSRCSSLRGPRHTLSPQHSLGNSIPRGLERSCKSYAPARGPDTPTLFVKQSGCGTLSQPRVKLLSLEALTLCLYAYVMFRHGPLLGPAPNAVLQVLTSPKTKAICPAVSVPPARQKSQRLMTLECCWLSPKIQTQAMHWPLRGSPLHQGLSRLLRHCQAAPTWPKGPLPDLPWTFHP